MIWVILPSTITLAALLVYSDREVRKWKKDALYWKGEYNHKYLELYDEYQRKLEARDRATKAEKELEELKRAKGEK